MYSYYLALVLYNINVLCVDIEITGDLSFDVKIQNYKQRGVDVDIPLRFSIGNSGGVHGVYPRVIEESTSASNSTSTTMPGQQTVTDEKTNVASITGREANIKLQDDVEDQDNTGEEKVEGKSEQKSQSKKRKKKQKTKTTTFTLPECPYSYPEPWEANNVLSNMMNKLTKLFVMMSRSLYDGVRPRSSVEAARLRRFKAMSARNHDSFDRIFSNMSTEFKLNYNASRERLLRANDGDGGGGEEPCAEQADVGRAWRDLLEQAQDAYHAAALRCVDLHLGQWLASRGGSLNTHLNSALSSVNKQLLKDVERIRAEQLRVLCRLYQLC